MSNTSATKGMRQTVRHTAAKMAAGRKDTAKPPAELIIDAAARCFARWGIPRTRVEDISAEVGIARPHIYRHYSSKEEIVHAVVLREIKLHHKRMAKRLPHRGFAADLVIASLVSGIVEASRDTYTRFLLRSDSARITAHSVRSSPEIIAEVRSYWEPLLEYARQRGELKDDIDIRDATQWLTFLEFSYIALPELVPKKDRLVFELKTFLIPALFKDTATHTQSRL